MQMLQRRWPDARFVHAIRNGIDTAASMSKHGASQLLVSAGLDNWCHLSYDHLYEHYERRGLPERARSYRDQE